MALTDAWLKANLGKEHHKVFEKSDRDGLSARVSAKGKITFQMRYRYAGKPVRLDLGSYPLLTLKEARERCLRLRAELEQGHDPRVIQLEERSKLEQRQSLEEVFEQWWASECQDIKASAGQIRRSFEIYLLPRFGKFPLESISLLSWVEFFEGLAKQVPAITSRLLTNTKQLLKWSAKRGLIPMNPLADINAKSDLRIEKKSKIRVLSREEIRYLWLAIEGSRVTRKNKLFYWLNLFYGCRNGELRNAEKAHFDFDSGVWMVPPDNHKMGRITGKALYRPIIPEVIPLLEEAMVIRPSSKYLFTNANSDQKMGASAQLSVPYNFRQWLRKNLQYEMEHWSIHDLRRTARTNFADLTEPHIADIMLAHKPPGMRAVYDHATYLDEQAQAYKKWWHRLQEIVSEPQN